MILPIGLSELRCRLFRSRKGRFVRRQHNQGSRPFRHEGSLRRHYLGRRKISRQVRDVIDWLIDWMIDWLIARNLNDLSLNLFYWKIGWLIEWMVDWILFRVYLCCGVFPCFALAQFSVRPRWQRKTISPLQVELDRRWSTVGRFFSSWDDVRLSLSPTLSRGRAWDEDCISYFPSWGASDTFISCRYDASFQYTHTASLNRQTERYGKCGANRDRVT